jgi:hypothetical protein
MSIEDGATWNLAGDSFVTGVDFNAMHIQSNGHDIYYDAGHAANAYLKQNQYDLPGGGTLLPVNVVVVENSEMTANHGADMYAGDTMLMLINATLTGELSGVSLTMDENSTWNVTGSSSLVRAELRNRVVITDGGLYTGPVRGADLTVADGGRWQAAETSSVVNLSVEAGGRVTSDIYATVAFGASDNVVPGSRGNITYELDESLLPPEPAMEMMPPGGGAGGPPGGGGPDGQEGPPGMPAM